MITKANLYINCHNPIFLENQIYLFKKFSKYKYELNINIVIEHSCYNRFKNQFNSNNYNIHLVKNAFTIKPLLLFSVNICDNNPSIFVEFDIVPITNIHIRNAMNKEPMDTFVFWPSIFMWEQKQDFNKKFLTEPYQLPFNKQFDILYQHYLRDIDHNYNYCSSKVGFRLINNEFLHFHNRNADSPISGFIPERIDCWKNIIDSII